MQNVVSTLFGTLLLASAGLSFAASPKASPYQLIEKIVQCKASLKDIKELNRLIDQKKIPFPESKSVDVWGGKAWDVNPPISFGSVKSNVVVLSDRNSLYLRVPAKSDVHAEMRSVAQTMHVPAQLPDHPDTTYLTDTSPSRIHILPSDEKDVYWVGCTYEDPSNPW